jgi:uncharacterized protein YggU (UPF0235/DUF167 family)
MFGVQKDGLHIQLVATPENGSANKALIELVAAYLYIAKSKIRIGRGERSKNKILEIDAESKAVDMLVAIQDSQKKDNKNANPV